MKSLTSFTFTLMALLLLASESPAQQTTAFSYQGQLRDGGANANGVYTFISKIYNEAENGSQIGGTITNSAILANGLFTLKLDFGYTPFAFGAGRWLETTVQSGTSPAETLAPRVQFLTAPYAIYAGFSERVAEGAIGSQQLAVGAVESRHLSPGLSVGGGSSVPNFQVFAASGTFIVPTNVTRIMVELWGGGGSGGQGGSNSGGNGGGGGGGGYGKDVISVTPGASLAIVVGAGGNPGDGGTSSLGLISASGGKAGGAGQSNSNFGGPGNGGDPGTSSASIRIQGVQGAAGFSQNGGGGHGQGGAGANGGSGGAAGGSFPGSLEGGGTPGGGGAGGPGQVGVGNPGSRGAAGRVIVWW